MREALHRLMGESLIEFVPQKGFYNLPLSMDRFKDLVEALWIMRLQATQLALNRASDQAICALSGKLYGGTKKEMSPYEQVRNTRSAWLEITDLTGNKEIGRCLSDIYDRLHYFEVIKLSTRGLGEEEIECWDTYLKRFGDRDVAGCEALLRDRSSTELERLPDLFSECVVSVYVRNDRMAFPA